MRRGLLALLLLFAACQTASPPPGGRAAVAPGERVTFSQQVVRVFQQHCQACHRPGEVAPFSLMSHRDAYARRDDIADVVRSRYMPPWKAVPGHGEFADVRRLSDAEIALITRWVSDGAPEGDAKDLPAVRTFPSGWIVHHVVTFLDVTGRSVELDRAEPGPGPASTAPAVSAAGRRGIPASRSHAGWRGVSRRRRAW